MIARAAIDASVALRWVLDDEPDAAQALALRDEMVRRRKLRLFAPRLFEYEVANGLRTEVRAKQLDPADAEVGVEAILSVGVELVDPPMRLVMKVANAMDLTAYDASYLVVAASKGKGVLWTDDGPILERLQRDGLRERLSEALPEFDIPIARRVSGFLPTR